MHPIVSLFLVMALFALLFTIVILRHRQKMALIAKGINPEEPCPLKTYRRALVLICVGIVEGVLAVLTAPRSTGSAWSRLQREGLQAMVTTPNSNETNFWSVACILTLAVGIAYLLYYRAAKKSVTAKLPESAPADSPKAP